ncbi:MAG: response regulator [Anaerolineaceae bacterium]|nr:response regulator [Anaerolineaceae bacterium]
MIKTLIIDDTEEWYQLISKILSSNDFHLTYAENSQKAKGFLKNQTFHLLILDAFIPDMDDWWSFYSFVKKEPRLKNIRVIVTLPKITPEASLEWESRLKIFLSNGDKLIYKPFTALELTSIVSMVMKCTG